MRVDDGRQCPCSSGQRYEQCCGPLLTGVEPATSAEALMRSRYTAYVEENAAYLRATWHPDHRPPDAEAVDGQKWLGLKIISAREIGDEATVDFVARFKVEGRGHRLHEVSQFVREDGRWYYTTGEIQEDSR